MLYSPKFLVCPSISAFIICVSAITLIPSEIFSQNFTQMQGTVRQHAEHMNRNFGLATFGVIAL